MEADVSRNPNLEARYAEARALLARNIAAHTGIGDERLLGAFARVPRHLFVPPDQRSRAYEDCALPIGEGQTISQPSMIAIMLQELHLAAEDRVLEVGAGCGYAAALLGELASEVYAIEILQNLVKGARQRLEQLEVKNVHILAGNGREGLPAHAPFDRILVSAGSEDVPRELMNELAPHGRLAIPVGNDVGQELLVGSKDDAGQMHWERSISCIFVPLVAKA